MTREADIARLAAQRVALNERLPEGGLTPWEREFIEDVYGKYRRRPRLSDKQRYRIEQIYKEQFGEDEDV